MQPSTGETFVNLKMGALQVHHRAQGIFGAYQLLLILCTQLLNLGITPHG